MKEAKAPTPKVKAPVTRALRTKEIPKSTEFALYLLQRLFDGDPTASYIEVRKNDGTATILSTQYPALSIPYDDLDLTRFKLEKSISEKDEKNGLDELADAIFQKIGNKRTGILTQGEVILPFFVQDGDKAYSWDMRPKIGLIFTADYTPEKIREKISSQRYLIKKSLLGGDALSNLPLQRK
jgi:hypothetical protein